VVYLEDIGELPPGSPLDIEDEADDDWGDDDEDDEDDDSEEPL